MSDSEDPYVAQKVKEAHRRLDDHQETHQQFDRRISRNENWRLQAQGALKVIMVILGTSGVAVAFDWLIGLF